MGDLVSGSGFSLGCCRVNQQMEEIHISLSHYTLQGIHHMTQFMYFYMKNRSNGSQKRVEHMFKILNPESYKNEEEEQFAAAVWGAFIPC